MLELSDGLALYICKGIVTMHHLTYRGLKHYAESVKVSGMIFNHLLFFLQTVVPRSSAAVMKNIFLFKISVVFTQISRP